MRVERTAQRRSATLKSKILSRIPRPRPTKTRERVAAALPMERRTKHTSQKSTDQLEVSQK
eukprot:12891839-Prorocentrum_lima.AAC.1